MIKVTINYRNDCIEELVVKGHSNFAPKGSDIVCAGVSAIIVGGINSLLNEDKNLIDYKCKDGYAYIFVKNIDNDNINMILDVITTQLYTIEESYPKFIKIIEK